MLQIFLSEICCCSVDFYNFFIYVGLNVIFMKCKMVRTRGEGSSNLDRVRSIASVRRKRGGPSTLVLNEHFEDYIEQEEVEVDDEGYLGGPLDKSLLVNYEHHVARQLWNGLVSNKR